MPSLDAYERFVAADRPGLYESHYLKANSPDGRQGLWIKHNLLDPRMGPAMVELWLIWQARQEPPRVFKREIPLSHCALSDGRLAMHGPEFDFDGEHSQGCIGAARWDVRLSGGLAPLFHLPRQAMYRAPFPKKKLLTPRPNARFDGRLDLDGQVVDIDGWIGLRGHNWGSEHAHAYAYGNCNLWSDGARDRTVDGFTAKVRLGPILSPWLSSLVFRDGEREVAVNRVRHWLNRQAAVAAGRWYLPAGDLRLTMEINPDHYVGLRYRHPDGRESYCYNTKFARVYLRDGESLYESECGELEVLYPEPIAGVRLHPSPDWDPRGGVYAG
ncbi:hypothetical protein [Haliangium sp.]|uniref:hypothetical protein n=1 Tax=Haliangium sp. TaxID=2663208 RepID=UPI003D144F4F